ncbi:MAG: AMP-binding protein [Paludibacteraceae bacterium]|nr:AMP-binding protein [Paludibacteraceae bacterium]
MATKHYLEFLQGTMKNRWNELALADLDSDNKYTYARLAEQIERLHTTFEALGIQPGDKIALCGRNCANWGVTFLAIETYKAIAVSILPDFTGEGVQNLVNHSEASLLYVGPNVKKKVKFEAMPALKGMVFMDDYSLVESKDEETAKAYAQAEELFKQKFPNGVQKEDVNYPADNLEDLALINYTSGTTSAPKGVMLSNLNLSGNVEFACNRIPHRPGDRVLSMLPIAHMFGLMFEFLYQVCDGAETYFLTKAPTPSTLMKAFAQVHPFMILTVPLVIEKIVRKSVLPTINKPVMKVLWHTPIIKNIIRKKVNEKLMAAFGGQLRYLIIGGAALNQEVEQCLKDIDFVYCVGYGMTECGPLIAYEDWYRFKFHSCGKDLPQCHVRVDSDDPQHKEGELQVNGVNVMMGYYKNEEATKAVFTADGWMRTGDLGIIDAEGNIFIKGRSKNMILGPSGQNIYPEEIEDKLNNMPCVVESVVVDRGGKLVALVFPDNTPEGKKLLHGANNFNEIMEENRKELNKQLPQYSQITAIELVANEFEKTPKRSIKRFMYK